MQSAIDFIVETDFGGIGVVMSDSWVAEIRLMPRKETLVFSETIKPIDDKWGTIRQQFLNYLDNPAASLALPLLQTHGTPFQRQVWKAIRAIPVGEIISYGQLAQQLTSSSRAVANACGANPFPIVTPCHRVVSRQGLGGFMQGNHEASLAIKRWLLHHEGVLI